MFFAEAPATKYLYLDGEPKNLDSIYDTLFNEGGEQYYGGIEPRMSLRVNLNSVSSIKLGYNRMRQYIQRITNTTSALPTDRWQTSNAYIKPQIADQVSLGYYRNFKENMFETSLETFLSIRQMLPIIKTEQTFCFTRQQNQRSFRVQVVLMELKCRQKRIKEN
ncbi:MAG: hypothetical protein IPK96_15340 [Flammeovirgaceae bacterium]|nr:hypothetical protein [Flammeovirgaceae bacterium]